MCVGVRAYVHACVRDVFAIYDNTILPMLIMMIIKIVFLHFIEIAQTDDFPSGGTRLLKENNLTSVVAVRVIAVSTCR